MPDNRPPEAMQDKLLLSLFGAVIGWGIKTIWDEYKLRLRWRRLAPLITRQLVAAAHACEGSFDVLVLPRLAVRLAAAQSSAVELVVAGVRESQWLLGIELISDTLDVIQVAQTSTGGQVTEALKTVRQSGEKLRKWAEGGQTRRLGAL